MTIAWIYLDKKSAAVDALKDFASMEYIFKTIRTTWRKLVRR
jgi:hypothetical protein